MSPSHARSTLAATLAIPALQLIDAHAEAIASTLRPILGDGHPSAAGELDAFLAHVHGATNALRRWLQVPVKLAKGCRNPRGCQVAQGCLSGPSSAFQVYVMHGPLVHEPDCEAVVIARTPQDAARLIDGKDPDRLVVHHVGTALHHDAPRVLMVRANGIHMTLPVHP